MYGNEDDFRDDVTNARNYAIFSLIAVSLSSMYILWSYCINRSDYFDHNLDRSSRWKYNHKISMGMYIFMCAMLFCAHFGKKYL